MSAPFFALAFTVALMVTTAYFVMGGLPLLILQHDTPVDGRFIRRFFEVYYLAALVTAAGAGASYALWGRLPFAAGALGMAGVVLLVRRAVVPAMARLGARIQDSDAAAVAAFRRVHASALLVNVAQLALLVWGITQLSL